MKYLVFIFVVALSFDALAVPTYAGLGKVYYLENNMNNFAISKALYQSDLIKLAKEGNADALFELGLIYQQDKVFKKAFESFEKSCEKGNAKACNNAGFIKHHNLEKNKKHDTSEAEKFYLKARDMGNNFAFYNLGRYYFRQKDYLQSSLYYELARPRFKKKATKQILLNNKKGAEREMNSVQREYIKANYPADLAQFASYETINSRDFSGRLPLPPIDGKAYELSGFMDYFSSDKKDAIMIEWEPKKNDFIALPIPLVTKDVSSPDAIKSLTYRYTKPAKITFTLTEKETILPVLVGDELNVYVYSGQQDDIPPLWEIDAVTKVGSVVYLPPKATLDGWEVFKVLPKGKGKIFLTFNNSKNSDKLILNLIVK